MWFHLTMFTHFFFLSLTYLAVENFGRCAPMLTQNEEIMARDHLYWFICCWCSPVNEHQIRVSLGRCLLLWRRVNSKNITHEEPSRVEAASSVRTCSAAASLSWSGLRSKSESSSTTRAIMRIIETLRRFSFRFSFLFVSLSIPFPSFSALFSICTFKIFRINELRTIMATVKWKREASTRK